MKTRKVGLLVTATLLTVGVIKVQGKKRRTVKVHEWQPGAIPFGDLTAPRMALRADFNFRVLFAGLAARRFAGCGIYDPACARAFVKRYREPFVRVRRLCLCPLDMRRRRSVAGFAPDRDICPGRIERISCSIVLLAHFG